MALLVSAFWCGAQVFLIMFHNFLVDYDVMIKGITEKPDPGPVGTDQTPGEYPFMFMFGKLQMGYTDNRHHSLLYTLEHIPWFLESPPLCSKMDNRRKIASTVLGVGFYSFGLYHVSALCFIGILL